MKRVWIILIFSMIVLTACQSEDNKLTVIQGAGAANNSLLVGFNELCAGEAQGFIDGDNSILISQKTGTKTDFLKINTATKNKTTLMSVLGDNSEDIQMSKDGRRFVYKDRLYDLETEQQSYLPVPKAKEKTNPSYFEGISQYSFSDEGLILYINPLYYIQKYYNQNKQSLRINDKGSWMQVGDAGKRPNINFTGIEVPEIDNIKSPLLLLKELKYFFLGQKDGIEYNILYSFDFYTKRFNALDFGIKSYAVSLDHRNIAYIKMPSGKSSRHSIVVGDLEGNNKRELLTMPNIEGLQWSSDGQWIAYAGGEKDQKDIHIIKLDGTGMEQLTQGMNAGAKIAWKKSGDMMAFTSKANNANRNPTVYIMKLNIKTEPSVSPSYENREKKELAQTLFSILKMETDHVLNSADKN